MRSSFKIVPLTVVDGTMSTSGKREYASITTRTYSPVGKGPQKSICTVCHGEGGNGVICSGAGDVVGPFA